MFVWLAFVCVKLHGEEHRDFSHVPVACGPRAETGSHHRRMQEARLLPQEPDRIVESYQWLFSDDPEELGDMQTYHRAQLVQHFNHMHELGDKACSIPVLWWFQRNKALAFYHAHLYGHAEEDTFPELIRNYGNRRRHLLWRHVLEDLHPGGRGLAGSHAHQANEVVLSVKYRLGYVVVRKNANTAIQRFMVEHLDANVTWCHVKRCESFSGRCTTLCLEPDVHLDGSYFFFSFVQHPVRRFFKAMTTLAPAKVLQSEGAESFALRLLSALEEKSHAADHHLETQSFALSSPLLHLGYAGWISLGASQEKFDQTPPQIQLDFIGRLETIGEDFKELLDLANQRVGVPTITYRPLEIVRQEHFFTEAEKRALWYGVMTPRVISRAHDAYAHDIVSLGYGWLNGSYRPVDAERLAPNADTRVCDAV